ncbi:AzlD domain-containing protein [Carnobacterium maltaromaticum]|uniref:AzlD domain-containing protein n=1 Tax=Carnobacterium maltaromaticum TaxID=2751 RepID=UPI000C7730F9|nr:AzlD domain-containing protein [Carnobacterium maltaromaticum]PLS37092.1 AzlD domain-containing protein [Carnobacterium maltaromaticum]PLS37906.1 AzlD domain-containing protein [Carnobacterium maltaromaticum]PLS39847.1 AzlD domain-containing protein [Carnobacterium maltaromaticum]PLS44603.1 AzlD domain-containing protein [Carnobacterium maltaromaticum]PLS46636.1 AzlD domain-containing protein [Carnobacterium maltaromaticum]
MSLTSQQLYLILGMAVVTYLPRMLPMLLLNNREIPEKIVRWMSFIPVSIFAALIFSDIFFWENQFSINPLENLKLIPAIVVFFIAYKTKNIMWSIVFGVVGISLMVWWL